MSDQPETTPADDAPTAADAEAPPPPPKMIQHTPIQCVTIPGLMESWSALTRLLNSTNKRLRDEMAKFHGVSVGDTIEYDGQQLEVIRLWVLIGADRKSISLIFLAERKDGESLHSVSTAWDPATCTVVRKGGEDADPG